MFNQTTNISELIAAGIGFSIMEEDLPLESFGVTFSQDFQVGNGPGIETSNAYWTTSGEHGTYQDAAAIADEKRSAGGWSDISAEDDEDFLLRTGIEPVVDPGKIIDWGDYRLYLKRSKEEREDRSIAVFDWLRTQKDANQLRTLWKRFQIRVRESYAKCSKSNDWSSVFLTTKQVKNLEAYYQIKLRILTNK